MHSDVFVPNKGALSMMFARGSLLRGVDVLGNVSANGKLSAIPLRQNGIQGIFGSQTKGNALFSGMVLHFPLHGHFSVSDGHCLYAYIHEVSPQGGWYCGVPLASQSVIRIFPGELGDIMLGAYSRVSIMVLPWQEGEGRHEVDEKEAVERNPLSRILELTESNPLKAHWEHLFDWISGEKSDIPPAAYEGRIISSMLEANYQRHAFISAEEQLGPLHTRHINYPTFRCAIDFMRSNFQRDIYVDEVAGACKVSVRSLRYAFENMIGISPNRYLFLLRLCEAHRRLTSPLARMRSIKSVALGCGFWNVSRFANSYRRMFGEYPSDTVSKHGNASQRQAHEACIASEQWSLPWKSGITSN
jgi:AraC family ethanolamine operon transcriptional activator